MHLQTYLPDFKIKSLRICQFLKHSLNNFSLVVTSSHKWYKTIVALQELTFNFLNPGYSSDSIPGLVTVNNCKIL